MPLSLLVATLCLTGLVQAANNHLDQRNLAYRSPYLNHDSLAVDVHAIAKRHEDSATILRKRQLQEVAPTGAPDNYITAGYGLGVVDWSDASYIFAGNLNFTHAVASGDPYDYSVLLWTRALPVEQATVDVPVCVTYNVFDGLNGAVSRSLCLRCIYKLTSTTCRERSSRADTHSHPTTSTLPSKSKLRA
jgi:alkaline phosphatase D